MTTIRQSPSEDAFNQNPYPFYAARLKDSPLFYWEDYGFWCAASYSDVYDLLRDKRFGRQITHIRSRAELGWPEISDHVKPFYDFDSHSLLENEPPVHKRLRSLVSRPFVPRELDKLRPRVAALAHRLIDAFPTDGPVELISAFATPIPMLVITELLGVPTDRAGQMLDWSHRMVAMYQFNRTRATEDAAVKATLEFSAYIRGYVEERRGRPGDDLISALIAAEEAGERLSTEELVTTTILILNAGHEATVHGFGNGIKALIENGVDPRLAFASEEATVSTVEECLRFDPPLHLFTRYALEALDYKGIHLRCGERIGLLLAAANRDPARFAAPDRFDISRNDAAHSTFGGGIHFCVGAPLARLEMQVALPILFKRLPGLRLAGKPRYDDRFHFHGLSRLDVEIQ